MCKLQSVINLEFDLSLVTDGAEVHYNYESEKKSELSMSCQFYWCDIYFFRDVCKLPSVVNFDCDLSLVIDGVEVHYNYQSEKKLNSPCHVSFTGETFICLETCANCQVLSISTVIYP